MTAIQTDREASGTSDTGRHAAAPDAVGVVRQCLEGFVKGDVAAFAALVAEGCPWSGSMAPEIPYSGQFTGPQGALTFVEAIGANLDIRVFDIERYIGDGEHVVAVGHWSGVARKTGHAFEARLALYFEVRDGKIIRVLGHEDTAVTAAALHG